jgi:hypothetical protein
LSAIPNEIAGFLESNIDSVDQLELLRILAAEAERT